MSIVKLALAEKSAPFCWIGDVFGAAQIALFGRTRLRSSNFTLDGMTLNEEGACLARLRALSRDLDPVNSSWAAS